ncbi:ATP-NAD kinase [Raphidocelis subcapitata]|uniref:ATP-NAD kinase n=1 Tax=Raphidocelis subcapitata TaxID=307507 RepID=A0A2V0NYA6_9CHLO|nr:ATP-NAD kinase [Raphidocelis subcapitata]|eukprot:GBF92618.1 ATP-NAD kinase [Raphidocelis subcapitata]
MRVVSQEAAALEDGQGATESGPSLERRRSLSGGAWPPKSSLYLFRTDGMSCSRELVTGNGRITFAHPTTQQQLLVWRDRPRTVMVIKKLGRELNAQFFEVVRYLGETEGMRVIVEPAMYDEARASRQVEGPWLHTFEQAERERLGDLVDFVVCLGGDGVILHAGALFRRALPPVLSFHLGSMGFMTNHSFDEYKRDLRNLIYGCQNLDTCGSLDSLDGSASANKLGVMVTLRMRLECSVLRRGQTEPDQVYQVLNEVVVDRGSSSFLTNIECYISGRLITRVQADGIMLATPTGSTAYSVAAGGSMVHPNVPAMLLTPVCPHSLNFRPIVLPDYIELELRVPRNARSGAWVCFDGKARQELFRGDAVIIKMSEHPVPTINKTDLTADWFESLERCFRWSERSEQKPLEGYGDGEGEEGEEGDGGAAWGGGGAEAGAESSSGYSSSSDGGASSSDGGASSSGVGVGGGHAAAGDGGRRGGSAGLSPAGSEDLLGPEIAYVAGRPATGLPPPPNGLGGL